MTHVREIFLRNITLIIFLLIFPLIIKRQHAYNLLRTPMSLQCGIPI